VALSSGGLAQRSDLWDRVAARICLSSGFRMRFSSLDLIVVDLRDTLNVVYTKLAS
jgi:hypothetical protein